MTVRKVNNMMSCVKAGQSGHMHTRPRLKQVKPLLPTRSTSASNKLSTTWRRKGRCWGLHRGESSDNQRSCQAGKFQPFAHQPTPTSTDHRTCLSL